MIAYQEIRRLNILEFRAVYMKMPEYPQIDPEQKDCKPVKERYRPDRQVFSFLVGILRHHSYL